MIWKTYWGCILINMICVNAFINNKWNRVHVNNRQIVKPYLLDNNIEVYETLIINAIITHESLRTIHRIFVPDYVCKVVKGSILLISGCVIIVLCK